MNYAALKKFDIANGPGVRVSLFVSGCRHHCKNCFNREAWDFGYGKPFTEETEEEILTELNKDYIKGLSLLGGEPFEPENRAALIKLLKKAKQKNPEKPVWCYTGFEFEKLTDPTAAEMLSLIDVLVDGKFEEELKSPDLIFRGSSNQRILDVKKSLDEGKAIWLEGVWQRKMGSGNIYE
ncbi:MAG: anaerobic ribonucleoside-triphosphate reductase activating protein [Acutalibacteraceae bacterium]|nr:anaerobic ribonucleoside-triphosphate reductase activating protein [Acutalibacteraceae bacterium]